MSQTWKWQAIAAMAALGVAHGADAAGPTPRGGSSPAAAPAPAEALKAFVNAQTAGSWGDLGTASGVTSPTLNSVAWNCTTSCSPFPTAAAIKGDNGPSGILGLWGNAAIDSDDRWLITWGGGHNGYYGNDIYALKFSDLNWHRLSSPSALAVPPSSTAQWSDGSLSAPHDYEQMVYAPGHGLIQGGLSFYGQAALGSFEFYTLVPSTLSLGAVAGWTDTGQAMPAGQHGSTVVGDWDSTSGKVYYNDNLSFGAWSYNPTTNTVTNIANGTFPTDNMSVAIRPGVNMLAAGNGNIASMALSNGAITTPTPSGPTNVKACSAPGLAWDSKRSQWAGYCGGTTIYTLDSGMTAWTARSMTGTAPTCTDATFCSAGAPINGYWGKFRYEVGSDAFLVTLSTADDTFSGKPSW